MWPSTFDQRLNVWYSVRQSAKNLPLELALHQINAWWFDCPWQPYYLHWDDQIRWPDPWQLLSDNVYCELARGLGILYTISLLDREDLQSASLILTQNGHNLVLVEQTKYILNWGTDTVLNTNQEVEIRRQLTQKQIREQYN
jgi:hypothetical protein